MTKTTKLIGLFLLAGILIFTSCSRNYYSGSGSGKSKNCGCPGTRV